MLFRTANIILIETIILGRTVMRDIIVDIFVNN